MKLLVAIDFSPVTERMMKAAERLGRAASAEVWLLHVAEPEPDFVGYDAGPAVVRDQVAEELHDEHRRIQGLAARLRDAGIEATALCVQGAIVDTVLEHADRLKADLIVTGSHGHGAVYHLLVGSIAEGLVKRSRRPVLVVPARETDT